MVFGSYKLRRPLLEHSEPEAKIQSSSIYHRSRWGNCLGSSLWRIAAPHLHLTHPDRLTRNILKGLSRKRQTSAGGSAGRMASSGVSASSPSISIRLGPALRSIIIENIQYCKEMSINLRLFCARY